MKRLLSTIILCFALLACFAQHKIDWISFPEVENGISFYIDDVDIDSKGNIYNYVTTWKYINSGNTTLYKRYIIKQAPSGNMLWQKQIAYSYLPEINYQNLLVVDNDNVYTVVAENDSFKVLKIDTSGNVNNFWCFTPIGMPTVFSASRISIHKGYNGHIYPAFCLIGNPVSKTVIPNIYNDSILSCFVDDSLSISGINVSTNGNMYLHYNKMTTQADRLKIFSPDGLEVKDTLLGPDAINYWDGDSLGNTYIQTDDFLGKIDTLGNVIWTYSLTSTATALMRNIWRLKAMPDGTVYMLSNTLYAGYPEINKCTKLNPNGTVAFDFLIPPGWYTYFIELEVNKNKDVLISGLSTYEFGQYRILTQAVNLLTLSDSGTIKEAFSDTLYYPADNDSYARLVIDNNGEAYYQYAFGDPSLSYPEMYDDIYLSQHKKHLWYSVKVCNKCQSNISGQVKIDTSFTCTFNNNLPGAANTLIQILPGNRYAYVNSQGSYSASLAPGVFTLDLVTPPNLDELCDSSATVTIDSLTPTASADFTVLPQPGCEMNIEVSSSRARPGNPVTFWVDYMNLKWNPTSGYVYIELDSVFDFQSSTPAPDSSAGNLYFWNFANIAPYVLNHIKIVALTSTTAQGMYVYSVTANAISNCGDSLNQFTNAVSDSFFNWVFSSYDPNNKEVYPLEVAFSQEFSTVTEPLTFQINFQNTGNDTAFRIVLHDTIHPYLNLKSFKMLASSHPYKIKINGESDIEWIFENILLPPKDTNELESQGFVKFSMLPQADMPFGSRITNSAAIYFDYNDAVITNTVNLKYFNRIAAKNPGPPKLTPATNPPINIPVTPVTAYPNPTTGLVSVSIPINVTATKIDVFSAAGKKVYPEITGTSNIYSVDLYGYSSGIYFMKIYLSNGSSNYIKIVKVD